MAHSPDVREIVAQFSVQTCFGSHPEPGDASSDVERPRHDAGHSPLSSTEVKNGWSYTFTIPHALLACKVVTLPHQHSQFSERRYTHSTKINRFLNKGRHFYATLRGSYNTGPFPVTLAFAISPTFYIASILPFQKDERSLPGNLQSR